MRLLEFLGPEQSVGEVDEESHRHDAGKPIVEDHDVLPLEPFAENRVADRQGEESKPESDQDDVQHRMLL